MKPTFNFFVGQDMADFHGGKPTALDPAGLDLEFQGAGGAAVGLLSRHTPRSRYERLGKPIIDRVCGVVFCLVLAPIMLAVAIAVYLQLGRPVMLTQRRVGRGGAPFTMYKFRTMLPDRRHADLPYAGPDRRRQHKTADDPRHVPLGRFLRKYSLDELPQLLNVVLGHMSLVGPRPELVAIVERYQSWQHQRHLVKPGLTGLWQVSQRGDGMMHEHTAIDLEYIERLSLLTDGRILLHTIPAALGQRRGE